MQTRDQGGFTSHPSRINTGVPLPAAISLTCCLPASDTMTCSGVLVLAATCLLLTAVSAETVINCGEDTVQRLSCDGGVISVRSVLYGRADGETCSEGRPAQQLKDTKCSQQATVDVLRKRCDGKSVCELSTSTVRAPDPCPGTFKYLETNYSCYPATTLVLCENAQTHLHCGETPGLFMKGRSSSCMAPTTGAAIALRAPTSAPPLRSRTWSARAPRAKWATAATGKTSVSSKPATRCLETPAWEPTSTWRWPTPASIPCEQTDFCLFFFCNGRN